MYKVVYISPDTHRKLAILKEVGLIKSISKFTNKAVSQAIKGIRVNKEVKKMKTEKLNLEKIKKENYDYYLELLNEQSYETYTSMGFRPVYDRKYDPYEENPIGWVKEVKHGF